MAEVEHVQKLAGQKQQPMSLLLKKALDVIYKTSAFEDFPEHSYALFRRGIKKGRSCAKNKKTQIILNREEVTIHLTSIYFSFHYNFAFIVVVNL